MSERTFGFIGLGNMGHPMATNLARAGFDVVGFDAAGTAERLPPGVRSAAGAADVWAAADTVLLSLPDGAAVLEVVDEIVTAAPRQVATVIDLSTVGPTVAVTAATRLAAVGVIYVDGPVSGGVAGAQAATISLMFAGPDEVFEAHRNAFEAFAGNVFQVGSRAGQGQVMKLLNNMLSATALAATSEALAFGHAHGLEMGVMLDVLNVSTGRNSATVDKFPNRIVTGTYDAGFRTQLMAKDARLYIDSTERVGTPAYVARAVAELWTQVDAAMPGSDFTRIWQFVSGTG